MLGEVAHFNDEGTGVHIWRMAAYSSALARATGHGEQFCQQLELAAAMHDTGKIGIPHKILKKPGPLDPEEWAIMKTHSQLGYDILSRGSSSTFEMAASIALSHHEKWDGSGYPHGLAGPSIPIEARMVAVADVFDALTMKRPYKLAWSMDRAIQFIRDGSGKHFDPALVEIFLSAAMGIERIRTHWDAQEMPV
jgi:putative two-component system response regulator